MQNFIKDKLILVESGEEKCLPLHTYGYGSRAFYLIHYVVSGKGTLFANGKRYDLTSGQSFIIRPYQKVKYVADSVDPWHYVWVNFSGELGESIVNSSIFFKKQVVDKTVDLYPLFKSVQNSVARSYDIALSSLLVLLNSYSYYYKGVEEKEESVVDIAKKYITANFHKSTLTVDSVAKFVGHDRSDLFRKFIKITGKSVKAHITEKRMDFAYSLLCKGSSIKETAYSVGYLDPLYFAKAFYSFFGVKASSLSKKNK